MKLTDFLLWAGINKEPRNYERHPNDNYGNIKYLWIAPIVILGLLGGVTTLVPLLFVWYLFFGKK